MNNSLKRLLSFALAVVMCISLLPSYALAEELGTDAQLEDEGEPLEKVTKNTAEYAEKELNLGFNGDPVIDSVGELSLVTKTSLSAQCSVSVSVSAETAGSGCDIVYYLSLSPEIDTDDDTTYIRKAVAYHITEELPLTTKTIEISELVPSVFYYVMVAIENSNGIIKQTGSDTPLTFKTEKDEGVTELSAGKPYSLNGKVYNAFVFHPQETGTYGFHMFGGECRTEAYRTDGTIIVCDYVTQDEGGNGHIRYVNANKNDTIYFYAYGSEEGTPKYTLQVFTAVNKISVLSDDITTSNRNAIVPISVSVSPETVDDGCSIVCCYGIDENINLSDEKTYIRKWKETDIEAPKYEESISLSIVELIPAVDYDLIVALTDKDGSIISQCKAGFQTESGNNRFTPIQVGDCLSFDGCTRKAFVFTASRTGEYEFWFNGGACKSDAYYANGALADCRVVDEYDGEENICGHRRYVHIDSGETVYLYATGSEEGTGRYSLSLTELFDEQKLRNRIEELRETGGVIELINDITLTSDLVIPAGVSLNLTNGTLTVSNSNRLTVSKTAGIYVAGGSLTVNGVLRNDGILERVKDATGIIKITRASSYMGSGEVYEYINVLKTVDQKDRTIQGIDISKIIAKKDITTTIELEQFCDVCSGYLKMQATLDSLEISKNISLPSKCCLNVTKELIIPKDKKLTVGMGSELNAGENAVIQINGTISSTGTISTSGNANGEYGRIVISSKGSLVSDGSTKNYGVIEVSSNGSEIKINESGYTCSEDRRCIEVIGPATPKDKNLNGLSEEICTLVLSAADMAELNKCQETKDWSCVSIRLGFNEINDDVIIRSGFIFTIPAGETVSLSEDKEIVVARDAGIKLERDAALNNSGTVFVFGSISNSGSGTSISNGSVVRLCDDGNISTNISVSGKSVETDTELCNGSNYAYSDWRTYQFTAPEDGWYLFTFSKGNLSWFSYRIISDSNYYWDFVENKDSISLKLVKGETVEFSFGSNSGAPELFRLAVEQPEGADKYVVETGEVSCGNAYADIQLELSAPGGTEYEYGVFYAPNDSSFQGGDSWFERYSQMAAGESSAPATEQCITFKSLQVVPGTEYMYQSYVSYISGGESKIKYGKMKTFTSKAINDKDYETFTELKLGKTVYAEGHAFYFDIPQNSDDMYVFTLNGYAGMSVYNGRGNLQNNYYDNYGKQIAAVKKSLNSNRVYVYVDTNEDENCTLSVSVKKRDDIEKNNQLKSYVNSNIKQYEFYRYTVPVNGKYEFSTQNGASIWYYCTGECGEYGWQNNGESFSLSAKQGEIVYLMLDDNDGINIRRYSDGFRSVTTAAELVDWLNSGEKPCRIEGNITLPLPAGRMEYTYEANQPIVIPDNSSLTIPNGVTLQSFGSIDVSSGGELIVDRGGCFDNRSDVTLSGTITINKTGELRNKGLISMLGGEIKCTGDCSNDGLIIVDCSCYSGNPKAALTGISDFTNVRFNKSAKSSEEASEFFKRGTENGFQANVIIAGNIELDGNLFVPYSGTILLDKNAVLTIPAGKTLLVTGGLHLDSNAKIVNNGTLKIYNGISFADTASIVNNGTFVVSDYCENSVKSITTGNQIETVKTSGVAVASAADLLACMKSGDVTIVEDITLPEGSYIQNFLISISNEAKLTFAEKAELESRNRISILDGTLDISASGAEIDNAEDYIEITNGEFNSDDHFKTADDNFGVVCHYNENATGIRTDLTKDKLTSYFLVTDFDELKKAIDSSDGWKFVLIECENVGLTSNNCPAGGPLKIPENAVLELCDGDKMTIESGAYVENSGRILVSGSGKEELLIIEEGSHLVNTGTGRIIAEVSGTVSGLKYVAEGLTIENCVMYKSEDGDSYWYYAGPNGENCAYTKTVFKTNQKVVWAIDKKYSTYATFSGKKDTTTATLTPKKLTTEQLVEFTATYGEHTAHIEVMLKPTATKISVFNDDGNVSNKTVSIGTDMVVVPFQTNVLPETAYYDITASSKNNDFYVLKTDEYIVLFKDRDDYDDFNRTYDESYITAVVQRYDGGCTLYVFKPESCIDEDTGNGKSLSLTVSSGKTKTSVNIVFVEYGDDIVFDFNRDVTGGEKLTLAASFKNKSKSDSIVWELKDDESRAFASLKTAKGITTLTTKKVSANTTVHLRAYSANNPENSSSVDVTLHPAASSAKLEKLTKLGENYYSQGDYIPDKSKIVIAGEKEIRLRGSLAPSDSLGESYALWDKVVFTSSNEKIIGIEQSESNPEQAVLSFNNNGTATVTLTYKNAANKVIKSTSVTFTKIDPVTLDLKPVKLDKENPTIIAGESALITAEFTDGTYAANKLRWSIDEEDLLGEWVTLNPSGAKCTVSVKTGCESNAINLTAKSSETDEISATIRINIQPRPSSLLLYAKFRSAGIKYRNMSGRTYSMGIGDEVSIERVCFYDASGKKFQIEKGSNRWDDVVWSSSASKTAVIDDSGLITATAKGTSKIRASYGNMAGEFTVNVGDFADDIEIRDTVVVSGKSAALEAYDRETGKKVSAVFSIVYGSEYASITGSGTLKAAAGLADTAMVVVKAVCKDAKAATVSRPIKLVPAATDVVIRTKLNESGGQYSSGKTINLNITKNVDSTYTHDKVQLEICQYPTASYLNPKITVPKGVTIDAQGYLTFEKPGTYTIKVTAGDGSGKSSQVKFNVQRAVETIEAKDAEVIHGKSVSLKAVLNGGAKADAPKNTKVTWSLLYPSNEAYCALTAAGKFTANANAAGMTVKVVVTAQDNGLRDIITVSIK